MTILKKYNSAKRFTSTCKEQQAIFRWYRSLESRPCIGADTETTSLRFGLPTYLGIQKAESKTLPIQIEKQLDTTVFGISLAVEKDNNVNLFWGRLGSPLYNEICKLLKLNGAKAFHNARYDIKACQVSGIELTGEIECTYTMSRIYWDRREKHSLQKLSEVLCPEISNWEVPIETEMKRIKKKYRKLSAEDNYINFSFIPDDIMSSYAMTDAFMCLMLYQHLYPIIQRRSQKLYEREKDVFRIVNKVEARGLTFDVNKAKRQQKVLAVKMNNCQREMFKLFGKHNPDSPKQVLSTLLSARVPRKLLTLKGKLTTGADVLRRASKQLLKTHPSCSQYIDSLLEYRSYKKTISTYLVPLTKRAQHSHSHNVIHCSINPADTRTGRMASRDPNLQNIPEPIKRQTNRTNPVRSCFITRSGYCNYYFDYSQFEMVIFGLYAQEELILDSYKRGEDIHGNMASYVYGKNYSKQQRNLVKNLSYGKIYGLGVRTMALMYGMAEAEAKNYLDQYDKEFPSIKNFQYMCQEELWQNKDEQGSYITDWFDRRYHISIPQAYKAVNALIQGSCASIFKISLIGVDAVLPLHCHILLPVHDELQIEVDSKVNESDFISLVKDRMTEIKQLKERGLTLRVDVSKSTTNWAEKKKVEVY